MKNRTGTRPSVDRGYREADVVYRAVESPLGRILIVGTGSGIRRISFQEGASPLPVDPSWKEAPHAFRDAATQLEEYFAGRRRQFALDLEPAGTPFQLRVWKALAKIPFGKTASYAEIARAIGNPKAVRAVGAANGANPIPIVVPCHRVIGKDGSLTGYHGGVGLKRRLLELEGVIAEG